MCHVQLKKKLRFLMAYADSVKESFGVRNEILQVYTKKGSFGDKL